MADLDTHRNKLKKKNDTDRDNFRQQMLYGVDLIEDENGIKIYS